MSLDVSGSKDVDISDRESRVEEKEDSGSLLLDEGKSDVATDDSETKSEVKVVLEDNSIEEDATEVIMVEDSTSEVATLEDSTSEVVALENEGSELIFVDDSACDSVSEETTVEDSGSEVVILEVATVDEISIVEEETLLDAYAGVCTIYNDSTTLSPSTFVEVAY